MQKLFKEIPIYFQFCFLVMGLVVGASITYKVVENFFFEGPPVEFYGEELGFQNSSEDVYTYYAGLHTPWKWQDCFLEMWKHLEHNKSLSGLTRKDEIIFAEIGTDDLTIVCFEKNIKLFIHSTDKSRASAITGQLRQVVRKHPKVEPLNK